MCAQPRTLASGQRCQIWVHDTKTGDSFLILETRGLLLEAPNWTLDGQALIVNGDGGLWRLDLADPGLRSIALTGLPAINNDHVLDPDGQHIYVSTYDDWQIYRAPLAGGRARRVTGKDGPDGLLHFLHGVSPDGRQLAFVGVQADLTAGRLRMTSAEICTIGWDGQGFRQITRAGVPADGPEYSPNAEWIYFNTEVFSGHAQIARMRPDGAGLTRLTYSETVDWFPHLSPDGRMAVYLAYPNGTNGHPENLWVDLMLVHDEDWSNPAHAVRLFGGQGTINVNSWAPDSRRFSYVAYPTD
ncbi:biopolymer transporter Tol [Paracoccus sp. 11-3]|uniref:Biopolymer transporter Tol n=1 Tax=Paracoccus amoyensis TaxID=2760093 RepID=A0A926GFF2_9RHOB|nr:biopolymer transporter Tol [Paracoccus amoyensis]MBC9248220.1 biopolymer transporter Tol [Paracoccus amoyensis]